MIEPTPGGLQVDLRGRVALVTGASGGLGARFAEVLAANGARVVVAARRVDALAAVKEGIEGSGGQAHAVPLDVSDEASVVAAFDAVGAAWGETPDIIVNNAGVTDARLAKDLEAETFDHVMGVNLRGAWLVAREACRRLVLAGRGGSIVNITSILARGSAKGVPAYAASKAALEQLTRVMALENARFGVRVNALAPGFVATAINADFFATELGRATLGAIPLRCAGRPEDLDGALLLLAGDAGRFITGATLVVDGGHLCRPL